MRKSLSFVLIFVLSVTACFSFAACAPSDDEVQSDEFLSDWMSYVGDDVKIGDVVMPGSRNAGSASMWVLSEQTHEIATQLKRGVRYFDFYISKFGEFLIFYNIVDNYFYKVDDVLADIKSFVSANPSEKLILNFVSFRKNSRNLLCESLKTVLDIENTAVKNDVALADLTCGGMSDKNYIVLMPDVPADVDYAFVSKDNVDYTYNGENVDKDAQGFIGTLDASIGNINSATPLSNLTVCLASHGFDRFVAESRDAEMKAMFKTYLDGLYETPEKLSNLNVVSMNYASKDVGIVKSILKLNVAKGGIFKTVPDFLK